MDVAAFVRGYLDLIGSSNRGEGIRQASDFLQPTVELTELLLTPRREIIGNANQAVVIGTNDFATGFTVPQAQMWRVRFLSQTLTLTPAADIIVTRNSLRLKPPLTPTTTFGTAVVAKDWGDYTFRVGTSYVSFAWEPVQPLYLAPGTVLDYSFFLTGDPGGGSTWSSRLLVDVLHI